MAIAQTSPPKVAFLGLGAMGFAMSTHLLKQGIPVTGYDVWKPTLEKFQAACKSIPKGEGTVANSPAEAAQSASIILLMVANHHHVDSALFDPEGGAIKTIPRDATIVICSTIPPTHPPLVRQRLDTEFSRPDIKLIDAPVSGGVVGSASGTLTIMASSNDPSALSDSAKFILEHLSDNGKKLYNIPGGLGSGTSAKALNQVMCGTHIVGGSEIMALASINGLNTRQFFDTMRSPDPTRPESRRYGWTWMFENRGPRMLDANEPIASATAIIMKDVGIIKDEETRLDITLPQLNKCHKTLSLCMEAGLAVLDDALVNQWYLGLDSERKDLAMKLAEPGTSTLSTSEQDTKTDVLLLAHALINFMSAYETVLFAQALNLMGEEQRRMWFAIIAGAAGGSRVFSEVIPLAYAKMPDWQAGFREYARDVFESRQLDGVQGLIDHARAQGVEPSLVETSLAFTKDQMA